MCQRCDYLWAQLDDIAEGEGDAMQAQRLTCELNELKREHRDALNAFADEYTSPDENKRKASDFETRDEN